MNEANTIERDSSGLAGEKRENAFWGRSETPSRRSEKESQKANGHALGLSQASLVLTRTQVWADMEGRCLPQARDWGIRFHLILSELWRHYSSAFFFMSANIVQDRHSGPSKISLFFIAGTTWAKHISKFSRLVSVCSCSLHFLAWLQVSEALLKRYFFISILLLVVWIQGIEIVSITPHLNKNKENIESKRIRKKVSLK